ncbi:hypothetical protein RRF57_011238 [Xylaria bambusicola]|uniref:Uncharacterized protein n=1 Tax=Xylaria bambusicola TaxID=326684 RepID=A0AAN7ZCZ8_9PEZI
MVRHIAEERELLLGRPEKGMSHDIPCCRSSPWVRLKHSFNERTGLEGYVAEHFQWLEIELPIADVDLPHVSAARVERMAAFGEHVEEDESQ